MRILITGGSGDLGSVLASSARAAGHTVTATYLTRPMRIPPHVTALRLDLTDRDSVSRTLEQVQPEAIIHTALSLSSPRQQIVSAAYHLSTLTPKTTRVIFVSTDMVFDGTTPPYTDDAPPSPVSTYGQAKAEMEMMGETVVRTSLIYHFDENNKQVDWMLEKIRAGEKVKLFYDEIRCPIWAVNLAEVLLELISSPYKGILNAVSPEPLSRLTFGSRLLEALGYDAVRWVEAISQVGTGRQPDLTLDVRRAAMMLRTPLLNFSEARAQWLEQRDRTQPRKP